LTDVFSDPSYISQRKKANIKLVLTKRGKNKWLAGIQTFQ